MYSRSLGSESSVIRFDAGEKHDIGKVAAGLSIVCRAHAEVERAEPAVAIRGSEVIVPVVPGLLPERALVVAQGILASRDIGLSDDEVQSADRRPDIYDDGLPFVFGSHVVT